MNNFPSKKPLTFREAQNMTIEVTKAFDKKERRAWTIETVFLELAKQVGDLSKRILAYEKYYLPNRDYYPDYATSKENIGNELADILYCVFRIAQHYEINLEEEYIKARTNEMQGLQV